MTERDEISYLVVPDTARPRLLARVRRPDVAEAISPHQPDWRYDPSLLDLTDSGSATRIGIWAASAIARQWGASLPDHVGTHRDGRLPAYWEQRRAWASGTIAAGLVPLELDPVDNGSGGGVRPRLDARRPRRVGPSVTSRPGIASRGHSSLPPFYSVAGDRVAASSSPQGTQDTRVERRRHDRIDVEGEAQIRCRERTIRAELVDLSKGGIGCVVADPSASLNIGDRLDPSLVLVFKKSDTWTSLGVPGTVVWNDSDSHGTHLGISFDSTDQIAS